MVESRKGETSAKKTQEANVHSVGARMRKPGKECAAGEALRWIRKVYLGGVSREELAKRVGVVKHYIAMLEGGSRPLSEANARKIAKAVARSEEDRKELESRLITAVIRDRFPREAERLEFMHVDRERSGRTPEIAKAIRKALGPTKREAIQRVAGILMCHPKYAKAIVDGELEPTEEEVRTLARHAGVNADDWLTLLPLRAFVRKVLGGGDVTTEKVDLLVRVLHAMAVASNKR